MVAPIFDYRLTDETYAAMGRILVNCAHTEFFVDLILAALWSKDGAAPGDPPREIGRKVKELKRLMRLDLAPAIRPLVLELRYALAKALPARNMMAHGILLYADDGAISFWSQSHLKELAIADAVAAEPWASYGAHCAAHANWRMLGIEPPKPLPHRPA